MRSTQTTFIVLALSCASCDTSVTSPESTQFDAAVKQSGSDISGRESAAGNETADAKTPESQSALVLFNKRILPIFQSNNPSSCSECHLSGVDLKEYILPTQEATFASLVSAGLIDLEKPDDSKLLKFIHRSPEKSDLISHNVRKEEFDAFQAWIRAAVEESSLLTENTKTQPIGPQLPVEVIRHSRQDRVLASFMDNIWTEVGRCAACHSPDRNQKQVMEHGEQVSWIKLNDPQATLDYMLEADLINTEEPEQSLLLLKPTMQVDHGGGQKAAVGDRTYKQFRRFIDDYAASVNKKYSEVEDLPEPSAELSVVTDIWFKIENVPAGYNKMLLQVDLYRQTDSGWSDHRVATSDRPVFGPKNLWQHSLSLTAPRDTEAANLIQSKQLPAGKYLAKIYVDQQGKLQQDFTAQLGEEELVGEVEFETRWPSGYGQMKVIQYPVE